MVASHEQAKNVCWICLQHGTHNNPLYESKCVCRGGAMIGHVECFVEFARSAFKDVKKREYTYCDCLKCATCKHEYNGYIRLEMAMELVRLRDPESKALELSSYNGLHINQLDSMYHAIKTLEYALLSDLQTNITITTQKEKEAMEKRIAPLRMRLNEKLLDIVKANETNTELAQCEIVSELGMLHFQSDQLVEGLRLLLENYRHLLHLPQTDRNVLIQRSRAGTILVQVYVKLSSLSSNSAEDKASFLEKAEILCSHILAIDTHLYPTAQNADTLRHYYQYAHIRFQQGYIDDARDTLYSTVVESKRILGPKHELTLALYSLLAYIIKYHDEKKLSSSSSDATSNNNSISNTNAAHENDDDATTISSPNQNQIKKKSSHQNKKKKKKSNKKKK
uniref:RING-CH-type domain-containing protein n=1 Tax=Aureoumbra lagunensis TaxID=44058 RepID=A0A7S3NM91_9STRA